LGERSDRYQKPLLESPEDRRKHLEFIQLTIARQAENSSRLKNWALTLAVAAFALAVQQKNYAVPMVADVILLCFASLDCYYLQQECLYRALYNDAIAHESRVRVYSMDTQPYRLNPECGWQSVLQSKPLVVLYGAVLGAGIVLTVTLLIISAYDLAVQFQG
jgi:hypothetical protein